MPEPHPFQFSGKNHKRTVDATRIVTNCVPNHETRTVGIDRFQAGDRRPSGFGACTLVAYDTICESSLPNFVSVAVPETNITKSSSLRLMG